MSVGTLFVSQETAKYTSDKLRIDGRVRTPKHGSGLSHSADQKATNEEASFEVPFYAYGMCALEYGSQTRFHRYIIIVRQDMNIHHQSLNSGEATAVKSKAGLPTSVELHILKLSPVPVQANPYAVSS